MFKENSIRVIGPVVRTSAENPSHSGNMQNELYEQIKVAESKFAIKS